MISAVNTCVETFYQIVVINYTGKSFAFLDEWPSLRSMKKLWGKTNFFQRMRMLQSCKTNECACCSRANRNSCWAKQRYSRQRSIYRIFRRIFPHSEIESLALWSVNWVLMTKIKRAYVEQAWNNNSTRRYVFQLSFFFLFHILCNGIEEVLSEKNIHFPDKIFLSYLKMWTNLAQAICKEDLQSKFCGVH